MNEPLNLLEKCEFHFNYKIIQSRTMGYACFKAVNGFWQQISKWYWYYGNLKRFCKEANEPCYYEIIE